MPFRRPQRENLIPHVIPHCSILRLHPDSASPYAQPMYVGRTCYWMIVDWDSRAMFDVVGKRQTCTIAESSESKFYHNEGNVLLCSRGDQDRKKHMLPRRGSRQDEDCCYIRCKDEPVCQWMNKRLCQNLIQAIASRT